MTHYPVEKALKDGTLVTIREVHAGDEEKLLSFFRDLPMSERQYLRMDVTVPENLERRLNPGPFQRVFCLGAEKDGVIVAEATLAGPSAGWMRHTAEIRCIVHPRFRNRGLGYLLLWELFCKSLSDRYRLVFCELVPEQSTGREVLEKLGFKEVLIRRNHVKDVTGTKHDLHIFFMDIQAMWNDIQSHFQALDTSFERY